jgi:hypothetical protein
MAVVLAYQEDRWEMKLVPEGQTVAGATLLADPEDASVEPTASVEGTSVQLPVAPSGVAVAFTG